MSTVTNIEWTNSTFNPWIGCTKVSPGCDHCYAEALNSRFNGGNWGPHAARRRTSEAAWQLPLRWNRAALKHKKRHLVFCASMADVFDNVVPDEWRADLFALIRATPALTWQLLTKRPQNIERMLPPDWGHGYPNVWLGTSVENQEEAKRRIPFLLETPAEKRFLSCEPLLGLIDLTTIHRTPDPGFFGDCLRWYHRGLCHEQSRIAYPTIDWVICGGESGPKARPMHPDWARNLRDQCAESGVPFFMKQWGEWAPWDDWPSELQEPYEIEGKADLETTTLRVGKKAAGRLLDGREWLNIP